MMDVHEALSLIERQRASAQSCEHERLEFKTQKSTAKETYSDLADAVVCFANGVGGTLVVGVSDTGNGPAAFVGTSIDPEELRKRLYGLTNPPLPLDVRELTACGQRLIVIDVPQGLEVYSTSKGVYYQRINDQCHPMRPVHVARLAEERAESDWSATSSGRGIDSIDADAAIALYSLLKSSGKTTQERLSKLDLESLVEELSLLHNDRTLTKAAEILLCESANTTNDILVYQHRRTPSGEADFVARWAQPMLPAFLKAMEVIRARVDSTPVTTAQGQQSQIEDYPTLAVREALVNALIHGDLREGRPVQVEHSPAQLTISSPGPLVAGITLDNILTHGSRPRFRLLAKTMSTLGLAEELGQGVDRMYRETIRSGQSTPNLRVEGDEQARTIVNFTGGPPNVRLVKFITELPASEQTDTDALLITLLLCSRKTVNAKTVSPVIQRDLNQSEQVLRRLAHGDAELLEVTPGTVMRTHPNYRLRGHSLAALGSAVSYHRRDLTTSDAKIIEHVKEYGTINNSTVQRLFDVDVYAARDILKNIVGREILTRTSEQTRGTKVRYGPGAKFPSKKTRANVRKEVKKPAKRFPVEQPKPDDQETLF
ncbi:MAG: putative DNA binding domain-containing protein [Gordonia sp. (in: high G+C Gram-positive bacteria)]|uniref:RNA-binding domain-containing protein n=1 Tax=Gordonia sp. (in: high G+C Gram-positive bacteria) TaxID=84139 RepID=UPI0039E67652